MKSIKVEIGKRYGKLTIVEELPKNQIYTRVELDVFANADRNI